jgi:hypothetical protein
VAMQVVKSEPRETQVSEVREKSRLGEPPVSAVNDVRLPLPTEVNVTNIGAELLPTAVVPGKVRGVGIWAQAAGRSKPVRTVDHRFDRTRT